MWGIATSNQVGRGLASFVGTMHFKLLAIYDDVCWSIWLAQWYGTWLVMQGSQVRFPVQHIRDLFYKHHYILKNFGTALFSLFTIKNKQTEDRFIVIHRISTCMYSACMHDPTLIYDRIIDTLKNQYAL